MVNLKNVSFIYEGSTEYTVKNIDIKIEKGECVLLCGASGSGKTTVCRLLNGLIPRFYNGKVEGKINIKDKEINSMEMYELAEKVGSVFQNPKSQFFHSDTNSEITFGLENSGIKKLETAKRMREVVSCFDIEHLLDKSIFQLSGGEKQTIAFASVFAQNPDILVLDEPSANLDYLSIDKLKNQIKVAKDNNKSIVISEHRIFYLADLVDKVIYFDQGKVNKVFSGEEFKNLKDCELKQLGLRSNNRPKKNYLYRDKNGNCQYKIENLSLNIRKNEIFKDININIEKGKVIGIVGNNGAGKSSLMKSIAGLCKKTNGNIYMGNQKIKRKHRILKTYMVMQDTEYQLFADSVLEECNNVGRKVLEKDVIYLLKKFDLYDFKETHPMSLSGGQRQRLAIILSILMDKEILMFDEPTSGLDYNNMLKFAQTLKELKEKGKIIFLVSHDRELLNISCDYCYEMYRN